MSDSLLLYCIARITYVVVTSSAVDPNVLSFPSDRDGVTLECQIRHKEGLFVELGY